MRKAIATAVLLTGIVAAGWGQEAAQTQRETEFWEAFGLNITVNKIFKIYLEKQLRYEERFSNLEADFMEAGVRIRLKRFAAVRLNYRYTIRRTHKRYRFDGNLQFNFKVKASGKLKPLRISTRTRLQKEWIDNVLDEREVELRNRVKMTYRLDKKIWPYMALEWFKGLGDNAGLLDKIRWTTGVEWNVKKRLMIRLYYHYQKDLVKNLTRISHIFGTKFAVSL